MKNWVGKSIITIGIIHTIFGFVVFNSTVIEIFREGLLNTVNGQAMREWVFWFCSLVFYYLFSVGWLIGANALN